MTAGCERRGARRAAWMSRARCARSPRRPARLSAAVIWATVSFAAESGSGALRSSSRASGPSQAQPGAKPPAPAREVLPQRRPHPQQVPGPLPHQLLVGAGGDLDGLGDVAVGRQLADLMPAGPAHVSQAGRVEEVILLPRHRDRLLMPGRLLRVGRVHPVPGCGQRLHPRPAIGLDHHHDPRRVRLGIFPQAGRDHLVEPGDPVRSLRQPPPGQGLPRIILHNHVMVTLGPVITDEQQLLSFRPSASCPAATGRTASALMDQCSRPVPGTPPHQQSILPVGRQGHGLASGLTSGAEQVLTCRLLP